MLKTLFGCSVSFSIFPDLMIPLLHFALIMDLVFSNFSTSERRFFEFFFNFVEQLKLEQFMSNSVDVVLNVPEIIDERESRLIFLRKVPNIPVVEFPEEKFPPPSESRFLDLLGVEWIGGT